MAELVENIVSTELVGERMRLSDWIVLVVAIGAIVIGCFSKNFDYATGIVYTSSPTKRAPTWAGRLIFIGIGILLLIPELVHLLSS
jgi:hypothetical protein